ncbi:MAG: hypothetical protein V7641_3399 [Blastocatellia bacterium]
MFGLMKARTCSLSPELKRHRRLHYCGTCKTIGSLYGQASRALLNHDTVFLAELLSALSGADRQLDEWNQSYQSYNCLALPRSQAAMPLVLQYAAAATLTLAEFKLADHILDSKQRRWRVARHVFSKGFRQAAAQLAEWDFPVADLRRALRSQEAREARARHARLSPDAALADLAEPTAHATAMFLAHGAQLVSVASAADAMRRIGRAFGALIYLLDALEDYGKDARNGDFNAIRAAFKLTGERLPAGIRKQVADQIGSLAAEIETVLNELPIEPSRARLFASRLQHNLAPQLGARLPVIASACHVKQATKKTLGERWRAAVAAGRALADQRAAAHGASFAARMASPLVFASVLPITFLFPREAAQAGSYRECLGLGLNLMALGSLAAAVAGRLRFSSDSSEVEEAIKEEIGKGKGARKAARKAAAGGGGTGDNSGGSWFCCCSDCDCCCDGCDCCEICNCCDGCDCCSGCDCNCCD